MLSSKVLTDLKTGASKCAGFVHFSAPEEAARAIKEMDGKEVLPASQIPCSFYPATLSCCHAAAGMQGQWASARGSNRLRVLPQVGSKALHVMLAQKRPVPGVYNSNKPVRGPYEHLNGVPQPPRIPPGMAYFPPSTPAAFALLPTAQVC